jgi:hypothetical protein
MKDTVRRALLAADLLFNPEDGGYRFLRNFY